MTTPSDRKQLPIAGRAKAARDSGPRVFWRSLEELGEEPEAAGEFPEGAEHFASSGLGRRDFMRLMGASTALAGAAACSPPREKIVPYVRRPPEVRPGIPMEFATSMALDGYAIGLVVQSHEGRPTKVEGNPEHPASLGSTGVFEQASVLQLYDPDRARAVREGVLPASFERLAVELGGAADATPAGLRFILEPQSSPMLRAVMERIAALKPGAKFTFYSPGSLDNVYAGTALAFGRPLAPQYDFASARRVLSLDADFLATMPFSVRWAREFAAARRLPAPTADMNRLYVAEPGLTPTGMLADHRLAARAQDVAGIAAALVSALAAAGQRAPAMPAALAPLLSAWAGRAGLAAERAAWIATAARDLAKHRGESIVIAGPMQPPEVHALAHLANAALGNLGRTVAFTPPATFEAGLPTQSIAELAAEIDAGQVDTLVVVEGNPSYTAPAELELGRKLRKVRRSVHLSTYANETSRDCIWFVPATHYLESWGDARAYDGTISFVQPLIAPLFAGRTPAELLSVFATPRVVPGVPTLPSAHALLQEHYRAELGEAEFAVRFRQYVQLGFIPDSGFAPVDVSPGWDALAVALGRAAQAQPVAGLEVRFPLSPTLYDGRFANNGWLQELPDPSTKLTWDNAAFMSPDTAKRLEVENEQVIEIAANGERVSAPVLIVPGHADQCLTLYLGYGRLGSETLAVGAGVNAYPLRTTISPYFTTGARVEPTDERYSLALTQRHWTLADRPIAYLATLEYYREHPDFTHHQRGDVPTLLPDFPKSGLEWAMTIDTSICNGCSACVVACQAENNVPIVGKPGVLRSREMHWLRIDRYFVGPPEAPAVVNQPMLCQHCEKAPCEYVCPVNATVHSPDGLNEMIYNRCIGTRFCSNNCPYKVRRFNWFDYTDTRMTQLQRNPNVTVRERGVMEKCTYCVQRIRTTEIHARLQEREIRPGEVMTACQQACPTQAIQFGSLSHDQTEMVRWRNQPRVYGVLHHQGTQPRTMYLAKITNPDPELV